MRTLLCLIALACAFSLHAQPAAFTLHDSRNTSGNLFLQDIQLNLPSGWQLIQDARSGDTAMFGIANGDRFISMFAKKQTGMNLRSLYSSWAKVAANDTLHSYGPFSWQSVDEERPPQPGTHGASIFVHGFMVEWRGYTYYGFSRAGSAADAATAADTLLSTLRVPLIEGRSLTDANYTGKKYYFGFGDATGSPDEMVNEVHYDVKHTNDIFTKDVGGDYIGTTLFDDNANQDTIPQTWKDITGKMTADDMYIQYSSGHGYEGGLAVGVTDDQVADAAMAMPAKEIVIFTMACFSGGIVDAFNQRKSQWQDWQSKGRTLYVLASSADDVESQTGPGTDPSEPNGPDGSAGSAFGFALWKALSGEADGFVDGVKDGFISLDEVTKYTIYRTQQVTESQQTPVSTGAYNGNLLMTKVPSAAFIAQLEAEGGTRGLSDAQILQRIRQLDEAMAVH